MTVDPVTVDPRDVDASAIDPLALDRQVCFALAATSRSVIALYRPVLEPLGLTHPQYLVMLALWERSPRNSREISDALFLEPATLSPLLKRLEAAGLITRRRGLLDERTLAIDLTDTGRALRADAETVPGQIVERLGLSIAQLESTRDALTQLLDASTRRAVPQAGG
ncbi:MAG TPA: MarR family transcriptional regulator [Glaciihabitans sp.]|nr:MarR family transcriptional regulator [Glaciihabitans sp.]